MVRTLLEEVEQLTGSAAEHVGEQLAEALVILARRLVEASTAMGCSWSLEPGREKHPATGPSSSIALRGAEPAHLKGR